MSKVLIILVFLFVPLLGMSWSDVKTSDVFKTSDVSWKKSSDVYSGKADGNKNLPEQKNKIRAILNIVPTAFSGMISIHYPISYTQYQGWGKQKGGQAKLNPIASRQYPIRLRHNSTLYKQYPIICHLNTIWNQQYPIQHYLNPIQNSHNPTQDEQGAIGYYHTDIRQRQCGLKLKQKAFAVAIRKQTSDVFKTSDVLLRSSDAQGIKSNRNHFLNKV